LKYSATLFHKYWIYFIKWVDKRKITTPPGIYITSGVISYSSSTRYCIGRILLSISIRHLLIALENMVYVFQKPQGIKEAQ
jgi:hypothetical protein